MNKTWKITWRKRKLESSSVTAYRIVANSDDGLVIFYDTEGKIEAIVNADEIRMIDVFVRNPAAR